MGKTITVGQGDTLLSIAYANGVHSWESVWNHARNEALRDKRGNPQVLLAGDKVYVPGLDELGDATEIDTGKTHTFVLRRPECFFTVYLKDECGEPYAGHRYKLTLGDDVFEGTTSPEGLVGHPAKPDVKTGELVLQRSDDPDDVCTWSLEVGYLNPPDTVSGVKARLKNLGYYQGPVDDTLDDATREGIRDFRKHLGQDAPSGDVDDELVAALLQEQNDF
jgi:Putative peptidoglycan binding domain